MSFLFLTMKHRLERVSEVLRRELGSAVQRELVFDGALVTITEVKVSPDLRNAQVYVGVIGSASQRKAALEKLELNRGLLQSEVTKRVVLKYTPHLHFHLDDSAERGVRLNELMDQILPSPEDPEGGLRAEEPR